ncbi:hypothetical protein BGZ65_004849, partial [Modicella reniformis]
MDLDPSKNGRGDDAAADESKETLQEDPLDIMLDRKHGVTVVRNLIALVLNGFKDSEKKPTSIQETIQAQELAQSAYDNL